MISSDQQETGAVCASAVNDRPSFHILADKAAGDSVLLRRRKLSPYGKTLRKLHPMSLLRRASLHISSIEWPGISVKRFIGADVKDKF